LRGSADDGVARAARRRLAWLNEPGRRLVFVAA